MNQFPQTFRSVLFLVLLGIAINATAEDTDLAQELDRWAAANASRLESVYKELHANPELSFQEEKTSERIARALNEAGFEVETHVGGFGVVGVLKNGEGPTVMIRTDMDALPIKEETGLPYASDVVATDAKGDSVPVMHACGHDVHMTIFMGLAAAAVELRKHWSGTLVLIAQPAEEWGAGASAMLRDGLFDRFPLPDYVLALHVTPSLRAGSLGYTSGYAFANVDSVDITVKGVGGHGAYPNTAIDPVVIASRIVVALQTITSREISPSDPVVVTVGRIQGGTKRNIIPDEVRLELTVRTYSPDTRTKTLDAIERIARGVAISAGVADDLLPVVERKENAIPAVYNDPELVESIIGELRNSFPAEEFRKMEPTMGGEDFAQYGATEDDIPAFLFRVGVNSFDDSKPKQLLHSPYFAPEYAPAIRTGIKAMMLSLSNLTTTAGDG